MALDGSFRVWVVWALCFDPFWRMASWAFSTISNFSFSMEKNTELNLQANPRKLASFASKIPRFLKTFLFSQYNSNQENYLNLIFLCPGLCLLWQENIKTHTRTIIRDKEEKL